jgi:beta-glucanase (GH16 family)
VAAAVPIAARPQRFGGAARAVHVCGRSRHEWALQWADEFTHDGLPDPERWAFQTDCNRWIHSETHNELQWYTAGREANARVTDGVLRVRAVREPHEGCSYTSARLHTRGKLEIKYGRVEVCAKLPPWRHGLWPAIWMLPAHSEFGSWPASGEIDLMEAVGWQPEGTIHHTLHTGAFNHRLKTQSTGKSRIDDASAAFHTYGLEWTPRALSLFVDDSIHHVFRKRRGASADEWPFDRPFFLLLNLAVGGNWGGKHGVDEGAFPASMDVRSVRVFKRVRAKRQSRASSLSSAISHDGGAAGGDDDESDLVPQQGDLFSAAGRAAAGAD